MKLDYTLSINNIIILIDVTILLRWRCAYNFTGKKLHKFIDMASTISRIKTVLTSVTVCDRFFQSWIRIGEHHGNNKK